ncbi:MAG: hypothetical protein QGI83_06420, partial [Candidatus Latescibacteria bacterium]|nr:hypothetical protein [Candidatus Latescibacterota bacterium]
MAHVYTPGLRVSRRATVRRRRQLPLVGEVLVAQGDAVRRDQVVARADLPGDATSLNLVNRLGITPDELPAYMLKREGDPVEAGEPIAETRPFIRWFKTVVESPVTGTVESISPVTGQVILRVPPRPVDVQAYVEGTVVEVTPGQGAVIETEGSFIQGIFGVGGERWGTLHPVAEAPEQILNERDIDSDCEGKILVGGGVIDLEVLMRAKEAGAVGVIGGGIRDGDLRQLLGYDLGVAITGTEEIGLTVIVTEGFGEIAMAPKTFGLLRENGGKEASISGATQIRAGVMRPEIIIPTVGAKVAAASGSSGTGAGLAVDVTVRAVRAPYFGRI